VQTIFNARSATRREERTRPQGIDEAMDEAATEGMVCSLIV
jgi:hypothetical protein